MGMYQYHCNECNKDMELWLNIKEVPLKKCPECGKEDCMQRIYNAVPFINKSGGFFSNNNIH